MNKEIIYIDDVVHEVRESKIDFSGVSAGAHVLKIEKYKDDVLQDTVTRNITVEASSGLLLDTYSAHLAYSFRKLKTDYTGACIRVREDYNNTEQDIGFVDGYIDTAALLSFVGSGNNGRIVTWYDQSGNDRNWTQSNASQQPFIVDEGTLNEVGGKVVVNSSGDDFLITPLSISGADVLDVSVIQIPASNSFFILGASDDTSQGYTIGEGGKTSEGHVDQNNAEVYVDSTLVQNTRDAYHAAITGTDVKVVSTNNLDLSQWLHLSSKYPASAILATNNYFEKILFVDDSNMTETENSINSYYSI